MFCSWWWLVKSEWTWAGMLWSILLLVSRDLYIDNLSYTIPKTKCHMFFFHKCSIWKVSQYSKHEFYLLSIIWIQIGFQMFCCHYSMNNERQSVLTVQFVVKMFDTLYPPTLILAVQCIKKQSFQNKMSKCKRYNWNLSEINLNIKLFLWRIFITTNE